VTKEKALDGAGLRRRIKRLGLTIGAAAEAFGLTYDGLFKQLSGKHPVSRQTLIILGHLERERAAATPPRAQAEG
jgi:hypothetical protein